MNVTLSPHPDSPAPAVSRLTAIVTRTATGVSARYELRGDLAALVIPELREIEADRRRLEAGAVFGRLIEPREAAGELLGLLECWVVRLEEGKSAEGEGGFFDGRRRFVAGGPPASVFVLMG